MFMNSKIRLQIRSTINVVTLESERAIKTVYLLIRSINTIFYLSLLQSISPRKIHYKQSLE